MSNALWAGLSDMQVDKRQRSRQPLLAVEDTMKTLLNSGSLLEEKETDRENVPDVYSLPYFQSSLFATILEDTIQEMRILEDCNSELRLSKALVDLDHLRALKYSIEQPLVTDELDGIDDRKLGCVEYKINKFEADRKTVLWLLSCVSLVRKFRCIMRKTEAQPTQMQCESLKSAHMKMGKPDPFLSKEKYFKKV